MLKKLLENEDIKRHIFSFGTEKHRRFTRSLEDSFSQDKPYLYYYGKELLSPVPRIYFEFRKKHPNDINPEDDKVIGCRHFHKGYTLMEALIWFYKLRRCHCCSRHCHRKPNIYPSEKGMVFDYQENCPRVPEDKNRDDCMCICRHEMRYLYDMILERII